MPDPDSRLDVPLERWTPENTLLISAVGVPFLHGIEIEYLRHPDGTHIAVPLASLVELGERLSTTDAVLVIPTHETVQQPNLSFAEGNVVLNREMRELTIEDTLVHTTKSEYDLLALFMSNPRRVLSRDQVFNGVWGELHHGEVNDEEGLVHAYIKYARARLGKYRYLIKTKRGVGHYLSEEKPEDK